MKTCQKNYSAPHEIRGEILSKIRSKRLRKKLHLGDFQEFGLNLSFSLKDDLDAEALEAFADEFILARRLG